jgi:hypothetical protein
MSVNLAYPVVPTTETCPNCKSEMSITQVTPILLVEGFEDVTYRCKGCRSEVKRTFKRHLFCMSITPYLDGLEVDPDTKRVLGAALEMTRVSLGLADDFANGIIARRVVELAKAGERNPDLLCEGALKELREHLFGD